MLAYQVHSVTNVISLHDSSVEHYVLLVLQFLRFLKLVDMIVLLPNPALGLIFGPDFFRLNLPRGKDWSVVRDETADNSYDFRIAAIIWTIDDRRARESA